MLATRIRIPGAELLLEQLFVCLQKIVAPGNVGTSSSLPSTDQAHVIPEVSLASCVHTCGILAFDQDLCCRLRLTHAHAQGRSLINIAERVVAPYLQVSQTMPL